MKYCEDVNCFESGRICIPATDMPRVVVIGGGFAGLKLVRSLKNKKVQVVLLDKNNYHQFIPLLYQVATSGIEPDSIVFPFRKMFRNYRNFVYRMAEVTRFDMTNNSLSTSIGDISYDFLVIATGSATNFFGNNEIEISGFGLKSLTDAIDIRSHLLLNLEDAVLRCIKRDRESFGSVMIVGGGPAGVELAGALAEFKRYILPKDYPELRETPVRIILVEGTDRLLPSMPEKLSDKTYLYLKNMGVEIKLNTFVKNYADGIVEFRDGETVRISGLLWTAGVKGELPEGLKSETVSATQRILVDENNRVNGYKNIFAIGDVAMMQTEEYPKGHPMVAQVAIQQGKTLAENILRSLNQKPLQKFNYRDKGSMATIGKKKAVASIKKLEFGGFTAWLIWSFIHLMSIMGMRNKIIVAVNWLWSYFTYDKGDRIIIPELRSKQRLTNTK
jgi:NADH dehydrogenase